MLSDVVNRFMVDVDGGSKSDGSSLIVKVNYQSESSGSWILDKTFNEIYEAIKNGVPISVVRDKGDDGYEIYNIHNITSPTSGSFEVSIAYISGGGPGGGIAYSSKTLTANSIDDYPAE